MRKTAKPAGLALMVMVLFAGFSANLSAGNTVKVIMTEDRINLDFEASEHTQEFRCGAGIYFSALDDAKAYIRIIDAATYKVIHTYEKAKAVDAGDNWFVCLFEWESKGKTINIGKGKYLVRVTLTYANGKFEILQTSDFNIE